MNIHEHINKNGISSYAKLFLGASPTIRNIIREYSHTHEAMNASFPAVTEEQLLNALETPYYGFVKQAINLAVKDQKTAESYFSTLNQLHTDRNRLKDLEKILSHYEPQSEEDNNWKNRVINEIESQRDELDNLANKLGTVIEDYVEYETSRDEFCETTQQRGEQFHDEVTDALITHLENEGYQLSEATKASLKSFEDLETLRNRFTDARLGTELFDELIKKAYDAEGNIKLNWETYAQLKLALERVQAQAKEILKTQSIEDLRKTTRTQFKNDAKSDTIRNKVGQAAKTLDTEQTKQYKQTDQKIQPILNSLSTIQKQDVPKHEKAIDAIANDIRAHNIRVPEAAPIRYISEPGAR